MPLQRLHQAERQRQVKTTWPGYVFVNHLVFDVYLSELKFNLLFLYFDEMINKQWYIKGSCLNVKKKKQSFPYQT